MTDYQVKLTPDSITPLSEGSLDSSVYNGHSQQRSFYHEIVNDNNRKLVELHDGEHFDDSVEAGSSNLENITRKPFNVIDNTDDGVPKRVVVLIKNIEASFDDGFHYWQNFILNNGESFDFAFLGTFKIATRIGEITLPVINAALGNTYTVNQYNTELEISGEAGSPSAFAISNNKDVPMTFAVSKNGHIVESGIIDSDDSKNFSYHPTFFIGATTDLNVLPAFEDLNTEISVFGVATADVMINTTEGGIFTFTLNNVTYA